MSKRQPFLTAYWFKQWEESYAELSADRQAACDRAAMELIKRASSPGLRITPIHPEKYYDEARLNSGDRIVFRVESGAIYFVDVVKHDDVSRYGKRLKK